MSGTGLLATSIAAHLALATVSGGLTAKGALRLLRTAGRLVR